MPRKNVPGFPGMKERRNLIEQLKNMGGDKNRFLPYVAALKNLDTLLEQYSRGDLFGLAPALTEEDRQRLMQSFLAAANAGEAFLADAENRNALNEEAPLLAERMQALLSTDYAALNAYDPARGLSLPEIQEDARTLTVDFRGKKLEVKSGLSTARIPMTVVDADGTKRRGFFSKARYVDITAEYQKAIEKAKVQKRLAAAFAQDQDRQKLFRDDEAIRAEKAMSDGAMERLEQQTNQYLQRKMNQRGAADPQDLLKKAIGEYERKRIQYALKMQAAVEAYKGLDKPNAKTEAERDVAESRVQSRELRKQAGQEGLGIKNP